MSVVKRVAIVNAVALNGGDAAILLGCQLLLYRAFPSLESIAVFSSSAAAVRRHYPALEVYDQPLDPHSQWSGSRVIDQALRFFDQACNRSGVRNLLAGRRWLGRHLVDEPMRQFLDMLPQFDLLCTAGGTYITEFYEWRSRIAVLEVAKAHGLPVIFLNQSLEVETGEERIALLRRTLPTFDLFLVRDARSASFLRGLGVAKDRVHQAPDAAFSLADPEAWQEEHVRPSQMRVAVSVREWMHSARGHPESAMESYLESVAAAVDWLVRAKGARVAFLSTCQGIEEYRFNDSIIAERVVGRLSVQVRHSIRIDTEFRNPVELSQAYKTYDFVIATRMHAAILALNAGVPALPIAYEFKTNELWNSFGLGEYLTDFEEIEPETFVALTKRFIAELPAIRRTLRNGVLAARASALSSSDVIRNALQSAPPVGRPFG